MLEYLVPTPLGGNSTVSLEKNQVLVVTDADSSVELVISSRQENEQGESFTLFLINDIPYDEALTQSFDASDPLEVRPLIIGPIIVTVKSEGIYTLIVKAQDASAHISVALTLLFIGIVVLVSGIYIAATSSEKLDTTNRRRSS